MDIKQLLNRKGSGKDEKFKNVIRYGKVSSVNPAMCSARVAFADKGKTVSHDLPIIVPGALKNKYYHLPDIDEDVLCMFLPNGPQRGFVLGSFYNASNKPPISSADKEHVTFSDGSVVEYDRSSHTLAINIKGAVNITASGNVNVTGDVIASGISLKNHVHGGVLTGGGNTGGPK